MAVLFLAGWFLANWHSLAVLLLCAGLADALSIAGGVSAWCVTPAYWFLIPAYAAPWVAGRLSRTATPPLARRMAIALVALVVAIAAFFAISNASFYLLTGYFGSMSAGAYTSAVLPYLPRYLATTLAYVAIVAAGVSIGRHVLARARMARARDTA
ncbi:MAG: hypothetical protein ACRETY_04495 [Steroidobacteraceae bacterium]